MALSFLLGVGASPVIAETDNELLEQIRDELVELNSPTGITNQLLENSRQQQIGIQADTQLIHEQQLIVQGENQTFLRDNLQELYNVTFYTLAICLLFHWLLLAIIPGISSRN